MKNLFVTIASFDNPVEANIIRAKLESGGVKSFLRDEHTVSIAPFYSYAIGNIRLQIHKEDLSLAKEIMSNKAAPLIDDFRLKEENLRTDKTVCPNCFSDNHYQKPLIFKSVMKCFDCGYEWKK